MNYDLYYSDIVKKFINVLTYAFDTSDTFSFITMLKEKTNPEDCICKHDDWLKPLAPYLKNRIVGIQEWAVTRSGSKNNVMFLYESCNQTKDIVLNMPNVFLALTENLPEDICFYRNGHDSLVTCSHEKFAYFRNCTDEDAAFLITNKIIFD